MIKPAACMALLYALCGPAQAAAEPELPTVWRHRQQLREGLEPWRGLGLYVPDAAFGPTAHHCRVAQTWPALEHHQRQVADQAVRLGVQVLKVHATQHSCGADGRDYRALQGLLDIAAARHLRVVLVLESHTSPCQGRGRLPRKPTWYAHGWRQPYDQLPLTLVQHAQGLARQLGEHPALLGLQLLENAPAGADGQALRTLHADLGRVIKVWAPRALLISGVALDADAGPAAVAAWRTANGPALIDVLTVEDFEQPRQALPDAVLAAAALARILERPLWVGAAGVGADMGTPAQRAQLLIDKMAAAAHIGAGGYFGFGGPTCMPGIEEYRIELGGPAAQALPHLATDAWAAVPGCRAAQACPAGPVRVVEPVY